MKEKLPKSAHKMAPTYPSIKKIIKPEQLAAIGAFALAFNELEWTIERLFFVAADIPDQLQFEISAKMGKSENRINIIKLVTDTLLTQEEIDVLKDCLGDNDRGFATMADCRNGVIHVRNLSSVTGVGVTPNSKGDVFRRLVRVDLLNAAYDLTCAINEQLQFALFLIDATKKLKSCKDDDQDRLQHEEALKACRQTFLASHNARLALPKLPKFPSESELQDAQIQHDQEFLVMISHTMRQWDVPQRPRQMSAALWSSMGSSHPPLPLLTEESEKLKK